MIDELISLRPTEAQFKKLAEELLDGVPKEQHSPPFGPFAKNTVDEEIEQGSEDKSQDKGDQQ